MSERGTPAQKAEKAENETPKPVEYIKRNEGLLAVPSKVRCRRSYVY